MRSLLVKAEPAGHNSVQGQDSVFVLLRNILTKEIINHLSVFI
jgi:hypothetical protein